MIDARQILNTRNFIGFQNRGFESSKTFVKRNYTKTKSFRKFFQSLIVTKRSTAKSFINEGNFSNARNLQGTTSSENCEQTASFANVSFTLMNEWILMSMRTTQLIFSTTRIQFLVFCGVFIKAARWIHWCRLDKVEDAVGNWADVC